MTKKLVDHSPLLSVNSPFDKVGLRREMPFTPPLTKGECGGVQYEKA